MSLTLSLNTNPLVNRFAGADDLIDTVARDLKIRDLQLTHEFIKPVMASAGDPQGDAQFPGCTDRTGVRVTSGMTGPYGRLNHFGHPDRDVRRYYVDWFKTFADISADLGAKSVGTQFAIFTFADFDDAQRREDLIQIAIDCWAEVAEHGKSAGLDYVFWEPMSVGREFGHTIPECMALQDRLTAANMAIPMWMMADIDHGDVTSPDRPIPIPMRGRGPCRRFRRSSISSRARWTRAVTAPSPPNTMPRGGFSRNRCWKLFIKAVRWTTKSALSFPSRSANPTTATSSPPLQKASRSGHRISIRVRLI